MNNEPRANPQIIKEESSAEKVSGWIEKQKEEMEMSKFSGDLR